MSAENFFHSTLEFDSKRGYIYPDTFGGMYADGDDLIFLVAAEDFSEYQYLQDAYPCVKFQQVKYSYNYLKGLIDDYMSAYDKDTETVYKAYVDVVLNRGVISVDKETLSHKTNDEKSLIVFELGSPFIPL